MTNDDYAKHFKVLGKLCKLYDDAAADAAEARTLVDALFDQIATGDGGGYDALVLLNPYTAQLASGIVNGPDALKSLAKTLAGLYLQSSIFTGSFVSDAPAAGATAKAVLEALIAEMAEDSKTFTTADDTGFVNFFETEWAPDGNFPQSGSPTHADATYVVATVV